MSDKGRKLYNGITNIDDDIIMAALAAKPQAGAPTKKKRSKMYYVYRWGGVAAAVLCLAIIGILVIPQMLNGNNGTSESATSMNFVAATDVTVCDNSKGDYEEGYSATATDDAGSSCTSDASEDGYYDYLGNNGSEYEDADDIELEDNQMRLDIDVAEVKAITISYPGYDSVVIEDEIAVEMIELIDCIGILTEKDDYLDVTEEDYATISVELLDGQKLEITPKYPYIFIDGVTYQGSSKHRAILNLAMYLNEVVSMLFE